MLHVYVLGYAQMINRMTVVSRQCCVHPSRSRNMIYNIINDSTLGVLHSEKTDVTLDITETTGITELLRNACVNCGVFPIVTAAGRIVNVAGFLSIPGISPQKYKCVDLNTHPETTVVELFTTQASDLMSSGLNLVIVHAVSAAESIQLFKALDIDENNVSSKWQGELTRLVYTGFEESGLE